MNSSELEGLIRRSLDEFYKRRIKKLSELKLKSVLRKKKPYLFRIIGVQGAFEIVDELLRAYMSASDETIFGEAFFEPIAKLCSGEIVSPGDGLDVVIKTDKVFPDFYIKLIHLMNDCPVPYRIEFEKEWGKARSRFISDFIHNFGNSDGSINWEKLLRFNSGKEQVPWISKVIPVISTEEEYDDNDNTEDEDLLDE